MLRGLLKEDRLENNVRIKVPGEPEAGWIQHPGLGLPWRKSKAPHSDMVVWIITIIDEIKGRGARS